MTDNHAISDLLSLLAKLTDIHEDNSFRSRSYSAAAFTVDKLPAPLAGMDRDKIFSIKGIGESSGKKILEALDTGHIKALDDLIARTPPGVLEMLQIKGLGPKKIRTIWKEMEIESIGELLYACQENRLLLFKGFGEKTQANVAESIEFYLRSQGQHLYAEIEPYALALQENLRSAFPGSRMELTGDFRRQMLTLEKLEWVTTVGPEPLDVHLRTLEFRLIDQDGGSVTYAGTENLSLQFIFCTEPIFTRTLFTTSGSKEFMGAVQELPEWRSQDAVDEDALFSSLGLHFIPTPLRERADVVAQAMRSPIPGLIQPGDVRGIIHSHSQWSDGMLSIADMSKACIAGGYEYLVISDHSRSAFYANGLSVERIREQHHHIDELNAELAPFRIFKSIECDILNDGSLDYPDEVLATFDLVISSVHSNLKMTEEKAMQRLMGAIHNPYTTILGHMTGRLLLSRGGYPVDHHAIIDACAEQGVCIEINAHPRRLDMDWSWIPYAMEKGVMFSIDPDAHAAEGYEDVRFGVLAAQKGGLTKAFNLSSLDLKGFQAFIRERRKNKGI